MFKQGMSFILKNLFAVILNAGISLNLLGSTGNVRNVMNGTIHNVWAWRKRRNQMFIYVQDVRLRYSTIMP